MSTNSHFHLHHQPHHAAAGALFCSQNRTTFSFNLKSGDELGESLSEQETIVSLEHEPKIPKLTPLFEKLLTPSDVGKLNRLVIPKQHAEKYFPLSGGGEAGEKGLLLNFEDIEAGKSWRFRYSYWNSSQSYVLTKGWSRFVKEKRLDAGDIVLFARHPADVGRLFIGWRLRNSCDRDDGQERGGAPPNVAGFCSGSSYPSQHQGLSASLPNYQHDCLHAAGSLGFHNQATGSGSSKKLRLFGVNLVCQGDGSEPSAPTEGSSMSSQGRAHKYPYHQYY